MEEKQSFDRNRVQDENDLRANWKHWEDEMGKVYLENTCSHICSATDCTGLIPAGHEEGEVYEKYETLYPYRPNEELAEEGK